MSVLNIKQTAAGDTRTGAVRLLMEGYRATDFELEMDGTQV